MDKNSSLKIAEFFNLAVKNHKENNIKVAQNLYEKVLNMNPNFANAHNNLGIIFKELGEIEKAKNYLKKAININPDYLDAQNNLGIIFKELGEIEKAKSCFKKVININPDYGDAHNNLGVIFRELEEYSKAKSCFEKALKLNPNLLNAQKNITNFYIKELNNSEKAINASYKTSKILHERFEFENRSIFLFKLKHDVQQARYLISKDCNINGMDEFQKMGDEILSRKENKEDKNNSNRNIFLDQNEINALLPFYKSNYTYQTKEISGSCINPNKNWQDVEDEYLNSSNQIIYIDNFLSEEAIIELQKFCLLSKVWNSGFQNKYLGAFSDQGFISPIHLQIAIELKKKLPKLFGPHRIEKFWGFKYDATLGKGINIHADSAILNLNFWLTPDEFNNNKNSGGLKVYDTPAPDNWTFKDYNKNVNKIFSFLENNNANCTNVPYKFNRAVLFNSAYFHETDEIDFKDEYEGRRINMTYLFGNRSFLYDK